MAGAIPLIAGLAGSAGAGAAGAGAAGAGAASGAAGAASKFAGLKDMFDGGGAGASGDEFEGGGLLSMMANEFATPYGSERRAEMKELLPMVNDALREPRRRGATPPPTAPTPLEQPLPEPSRVVTSHIPPPGATPNPHPPMEFEELLAMLERQMNVR